MGANTFAQSEPAPKDKGRSSSQSDASKPTGQTTKNARKDLKGQPPKSGRKNDDGGVGNADDDTVDPSGPSGNMNSEREGAANGKVAEHNWSAAGIHVAHHAAAKYSRNGVTIAPTDGQKLVEATFQLAALRSDANVVDRYLKVWTSADRKELTRRAKLGARLLESKNIFLSDPEGKRYQALLEPG
jgi:hypothetical protein